MKRLLSRVLWGLPLPAAVLVFGLIGHAIGANYGPMMIQQYGADIDNPSLFWTNIGGGALGKLAVGPGLASNGTTASANVLSVFGRTGAVTLQSSDVTGALAFTPLNKAGDSMTGLLALNYTATATAAGTNQGTATAITAQTTIFTTVAAGTGGVLNSTLGVPQLIANRGANVLTIYPFGGAAIEANSTNAAVTIAVGGEARFVCPTATQCYAGI